MNELHDIKYWPFTEAETKTSNVNIKGQIVNSVRNSCLKHSIRLIHLIGAFFQFQPQRYLLLQYFSGVRPFFIDEPILEASQDVVPKFFFRNSISSSLFRLKQSSIMSCMAYFFRMQFTLFSIFIYYFGKIIQILSNQIYQQRYLILSMIQFSQLQEFLNSVILFLFASTLQICSLISNIYNVRMYELIQYGVLTIICTSLVLSYSAPSVSWHVKFWSILTWVLNFGLALLVPQDTYLSLLYRDVKTEDKQRISNEYLILYWSVYILTWTIIPVLQEWENSGDFKSMDRLKRSLKVNGWFYLYMLIGAVIILIPLIIFNVGGDMGLITYAKCLATCWGIFLQMIMMGYAIVQIPRSFWVSGHPEMHMYYSYRRIPEIEEQINQAMFQFKQICAYILHTKQTKKEDKQIQEYCQSSIQHIPEQLKFEIPIRYNDYLTHLDYLQGYPIGLQSMIQHHRLMKRVVARIRRLKTTLEQTVRSAILDEQTYLAIKTNQPLDSIIISTTPFKEFWIVKLKPLFYRIGCIFMTLFGILITIAETQVFLTNKSSFLGWLLLLENINVTRILVFIVIGLISYMVYYSLFRIKLSNIYGMYKGGSDGPSIMFATINFSRVGVAIVLNFFDMIKLNSIYKEAMGTVNMGLLGQWVIKGIPGVLWLIILCHYFDLWGKFIKTFKLSESWKFNTHLFDQEEKPQMPYAVSRKKEQLRRQKGTKAKAIELSLQQKLI